MKSVSGWVPISLLVVVCWLPAACRTSYYKNAADNEVYEIIQQVENSVFGRTNAFSIDTRYSDREPEEILPLEIIEDRQRTNTLSLTIDGVVDLAVRNSRLYQVEKERLYLTALSLTGARYEFSPQFFANSQGTYTRTASGEEFGAVNSRVGLSQFFKTGASLGASIASDLLRFYTGDPRESAVTTLSVNLVQPLLRGAGKSIVAENLTQAERDVIYAIRTFSQFQNEFAVDIVLEYFRLLQDRDDIRNQYANYERRVEARQLTEARFDAGRVDQLEMDDSQSTELSAEANYVSAVADYFNNLDQFKITLGLPLTTELRLDETALDELREVGLRPVPRLQEQAFQIAITNQLELLNDIDAFEDRQRQVKVTANRLKPGLNIFGDASLESTEPTDYTRFNFDDIRAGVGIELDLPLDRLNERNQYRAALVNFEAAIRNLGEALDGKRNEIDQGFRNLARGLRNYNIALESLRVDTRRAEGAQLRYDGGFIEYREVREAQDSLLQAQTVVTSALVSHLQDKMRLLLDIGILDTRVEKFWISRDAFTIPLDDSQSVTPENGAQDEILTPDRLFEMNI